MTEITKPIAFTLLIGCFSSLSLSAQGQPPVNGDANEVNVYKICSENKILNPKFDLIGGSSTDVTNWTFTPAGDYYWGWRRDESLIYGNTLFIDRKQGTGLPPNNTNTAASNTMTLCANGAKMVKLSFLSSNTGHYKMEVKLAGVTIGTFTHSGDLAQNIFTPAEGIVYSIFYNFWPSHYVTDNKVNNNIWHDFTIFIPHNKIAAASGSLEFVYAKSEPSRMVYLDNIEVYEAIPAPVPTATQGVIDCSQGEGTFNLNTLLPDGAGTAEHLYTYRWYTDATQTNEVAAPTAVKIGHYYLYATSVCTGCTSKASTPVRVDTQNCCEANVIKNNFFDDFTTNGSNTGGGPLNGTPKAQTIPYWQFDHSDYYAITVGEFWNGHTVLSMDPAPGGTEAPFWQEMKVCPGDVLEISMLYGMTRNAADFQNRKVDVMLDGVRLLSYNAWSRTASVGGIDITIINVNSSVSDIRVAGNPYTTGQVIPDNSMNKVTFQYKVPADTPSAVDFTFVTGQGALPYFDDVIIKSIAHTPAILAIDLACDDETVDLTLCEPASNPDFRYQWRTSATIGSPLVPDPTKVGMGTYYMETISICSGCPATEYKPTTVSSADCPTISGKLYADFDGADNGINNNPGQGFNGGGMYALLMNNSSGNVIKSQKIANDGSFSFRATEGTYRLMINNADVAADTAAPTTATLNPNYVITGEGGGSGTINSDGTPDGIINNIILGSSGETTVAFGINARPTASNYRFGECGNGTETTYTLPLLRSVDDDPNWNEGRGQYIVIETVSDLNNGVFKYDGTDIVANTPISDYDPAKLTFLLTNAAEKATGKFTYVYVDKNDTESAVAGEVSYTVSRPAAITITPATICEGKSVDLATLVVDANDSGATYTFHTGTPTTSANRLSNTVVSPAATTTYYLLANKPEESLCKNQEVSFSVVVDSCSNYWKGDISTDWNNTENWTQSIVPAAGEDVEFATAENNNSAPAVSDLHVPTTEDKLIGNLINASDKNLVVTPESKITIGGAVSNTSTGTIIVKAVPDKALGTLLFTDAATNVNTNLPVTVEFYNKGYDCATCGFYTRKWQYFGIPVKESAFPYSNPVVETVNQWSEPTNGNKWITPVNPLTAFTGYEITNSATTEPTTIYRFTGKLNLSNATVALTKTAGVNYAGMNLVANSYTAAIPIKEEALQFSAPLANKTVYLFNAGTRDQWRKLNGSTVTHNTQSGQYKAVPIHVAGAAGLPGIIPSMHTFMLQVDAANTLSIKYDQLVKNATVDGMAWRSASGDVLASGSTLSRGEEVGEMSYIVMDVIGAQSADRVWLFENPSTTRGFDNGWDGVKLPEAGIVQLFASGNNGDKYQVSTVPQLEDTELGFISERDGDYSLNFSVTRDVEARNLYLHDLRSKQFYPIRNHAEYNIMGYATSLDNRFKVVSKTAAAAIHSQIQIFTQNNRIMIVNHTQEKCTAHVYDISGRMLLQHPVRERTTEYLDVSARFSSGVFVVKVTGKTVNTSGRVMLYFP